LGFDTAWTQSGQSAAADEGLEFAVHLTFGTSLGIHIETCLTCGGTVRIIGCIRAPDVIEKILAHLDAKTSDPEAPRRPPCGASPERRLLD
jgi:hypothetical protein